MSSKDIYESQASAMLGKDIYKLIASGKLKVPYDSVSPHARRLAKAESFADIYGNVNKLSNQLKEK